MLGYTGKEDVYSVERFSGFADVYNAARPRPPVKTCEIITAMMNGKRVGTVVDLGCGTGLSTAIWKDRADTVIGIEPNDDMRNEAIIHNPEITFIKADSYRTGMEEKSADVVVCSQSFHWMEPTATLNEIGRILKPDGVLAILDCDWPVTISKDAEIAYIELFETLDGLYREHSGTLPAVMKWPKTGHLKNLRKSKLFRYCKEICFDNLERCDSGRFIDLALSQGQLQTLLRHGIDGVEEAIRRFKEAVRKDIREEKNMYVSYHLILGMK